MYEQKTLFLDVETTDLVKKVDVPGKRPGTTRKEQIPYETMYMDYPYIVGMAWAINDDEPVEYIFNQEGREIPKEASDIHGITTEIANQSPFTLNHGMRAMLNDCYEGDIVDIVVGHGIYFDTSILKANALREIDLKRKEESLTTLDYEDLTRALHKYKRIDTLRSSMKLCGKWPKLEELHMKIFRKGFEGAHSAKADVNATRSCYEWLLQEGIVPTFSQLMEKAQEKEKKLIDAG